MDTDPHSWLDQHILEQAINYGLTVEEKRNLFAEVAEFSELLELGLVEEPERKI